MGSGGCSLPVVRGLLLVAASPVGGTGSRVLGLQQLWLVGLGVAPPGLQSTSSVVVVPMMFKGGNENNANTQPKY